MPCRCAAANDFPFGWVHKQENFMALHDDKDPIPVHFPLRGEWYAPHTPGHKIPSHGIDQLGQRFAYDFVQADDYALAHRFWTGVRYWFAGGVSLSETKGRGVAIESPIDGRVVAAKDGWPEPSCASPLDLFGVLTLGMRLTEEKLRGDFRIAAGNYLIIEGQEGYAFLAHATTGSISVSEGETIVAGQPVAKVGHTGNSTAPHLHFHMMDGPDLWTANGLPCCFRAYEEFRDGEWKLVENGIPPHDNRLRSVEQG